MLVGFNKNGRDANDIHWVESEHHHCLCSSLTVEFTIRP